MASILAIAQEAADAPEINLARPSSLFAASNQGDTTDRKLLRALTRSCRALAAANDWQALRRERLFTSLAAETQTGMIPADFLRFVPATMINRATRLEITGPTPPDQWQWIKAGMGAAAVSQYVQRGDDILIYPAPAAGQTFAFEYITRHIGRAATSTSFTGNTTSASRTVAVADTSGLAIGQVVTGSGMAPYAAIESISTNASVTLSLPATATATAVPLAATLHREAFAADTDEPFWERELLVLGTVFHLKRGEGFDAIAEERDWRVCWADRLKQDGGRRVYNMAGGDPRSVESRLAALKNNAVVVRAS